jgi:hypothetical protein
MDDGVSEFELLERVGEVLYGPFWQTEIARDLGVSRRSIQRWRVGDHRPVGQFGERDLRGNLYELVSRRADDLQALKVELKPPRKRRKKA